MAYQAGNRRVQYLALVSGKHGCGVHCGIYTRRETRGSRNLIYRLNGGGVERIYSIAHYSEPLYNRLNCEGRRTNRGESNSGW